MKVNQKIAALILLSACVFTQTANAAEESALEQIVSDFVKTAVHNAGAEIDIQVKKALASASDFAGFNKEDTSNNKVVIIDLPSAQKDLEAITEVVKKKDNTTITSEQTTVE